MCCLATSTEFPLAAGRHEKQSDSAMRYRLLARSAACAGHLQTSIRSLSKLVSCVGHPPLAAVYHSLGTDDVCYFATCFLHHGCSSWRGDMDQHMALSRESLPGDMWVQKMILARQIAS